MTTLLAFHNDQKIKDKYLRRVQEHRKADQIVKGIYWEKGKGCAVGCTIHSSNHASYEDELGIPRILASLEDRIFENLPNELALSWPERFLDAITPGADLSMVWSRFAHWLLVDENHGVIKHAKTERTKKSIQLVADTYEEQINNGPVAISEWREVRAYAADAAAYAADADAAADDADAADAYAYAAAADAAYADAADAYAYAAAADAAYADAADAYAADADAAAYAADARSQHFTAQSEKLLELLRDAK